MAGELPQGDRPPVVGGELAQERLPTLGDEVEGVIAERLGEQDWRVETDTLPPGWHARLRSRSSRFYDVGVRDRFWLYDISTEQWEWRLSDSDFERYTFGPNQGPAYIAGLRGVLALIRSETPRREARLEDLSEVKGMYNRCLRNDQWDWCTVYRAFGFARLGPMDRAARWLGQLRLALRDGDATRAHEVFAEPIRDLVEETCARALARIEATIPSTQRGHAVPAAK